MLRCAPGRDAVTVGGGARRPECIVVAVDVPRPRYASRMESLVISTLAYPFIAWWLHRKLEDVLPPGGTRKLIVFLGASIACWAIGSAIDWAFPGQAIQLF